MCSGNEKAKTKKKTSVGVFIKKKKNLSSRSSFPQPDKVTAMVSN